MCCISKPKLSPPIDCVKAADLKALLASVIPLFVSRSQQEHTRSKPEARPIVRLLQAIDVCFARIYHRLSILAPCTLPRSGPAILVCNHTSGLDPLLIQSACPRLITWMMAREYYEIRGLNRIFQTIGAIPVDRSGRDLAATRAALRALNDGRILGIFPEGRIEPTRELLPFQTGVAMMAIKSNVPIYPAYLDGTQRGREMMQGLLSPCTAKLAFGKLVEIARVGTSREQLELATNSIVHAVLYLQNFVESRS